MADEMTPPIPHLQKWWHLFLVYPALAASLWAAIPTVYGEIKAWRLGVERTQLAQIAEQTALWTKNLDCVKLQPVYTIVIDENTSVGISLCSSGDALLRYQRDPENVHYKWIGYPSTRRPIEPQHSSAGDSPTPRTTIVYGAVRCLALHGQVAMLVRHDEGLLDAPLSDHLAQTCTVEWVSVLKGVMLQRRATACAVCEV